MTLKCKKEGFKQFDDRTDFQVFLDSEVVHAAPKNKKERDEIVKKIIDKYAESLKKPEQSQK